MQGGNDEDICIEGHVSATTLNRLKLGRQRLSKRGSKRGSKSSVSALTDEKEDDEDHYGVTIYPLEGL
jgi:hypothetical protein